MAHSCGHATHDDWLQRMGCENGCRNMSESERVARGLIERTLPKVEWTHQAHLRAGLWHVHRYGADEALRRLRRAITSFNESVGTTNSDSSGYHETLTRFYIAVIAQFLAREDASLSLDTLAERLIAEFGDRELPLRFYSRERLFSIDARRRWVEPDLLRLSFHWAQHHPSDDEDARRQA